MGSAFHQLCPRYSGTLTPTAPMAIRLWDTFTFTLPSTLQKNILQCWHNFHPPPPQHFWFVYTCVIPWVFWVFCVVLWPFPSYLRPRRLGMLAGHCTSLQTYMKMKKLEIHHNTQMALFYLVKFFYLKKPLWKPSVKQVWHTLMGTQSCIPQN